MNKNGRQLITKNMLLDEIVKNNPKMIRILLKHNIECTGCDTAMWESIEQVAQEHGVDVGSLVKELNNT